MCNGGESIRLVEMKACAYWEFNRRNLLSWTNLLSASHRQVFDMQTRFPKILLYPSDTHLNMTESCGNYYSIHQYYSETSQMVPQL